MRTNNNVQNRVLQTYGGDGNGIGVIFGGKGTTIISSGEADYVVDSLNLSDPRSGTNEVMIVASDKSIDLYSNLQNGSQDLSAPKHAYLSTAGNWGVDGDIRFMIANQDVFLSQYLKDLVIYRTFSIDNLEVAANSNIDKNITFTTPTGYKPMQAVAGYQIFNATTSGAGSTYCVPTVLWNDTSNVQVRIRNFASTLARIRVIVSVGFIKNIFG